MIEYLSLQLGLEGQLQVVEGECSGGQIVHGSLGSLAAGEEGGVGGEGPEASHHCNCLQEILSFSFRINENTRVASILRT